MKPLSLAVDGVLWLAWCVATVSGDLSTLFLISLGAVAVRAARQDRANGVRPFMKIS